MTYLTAAHLIYLCFSLIVVFWLGNNLFRNGRPFLIDCFRGSEVLADAVNRLLLIGFYLINIAYMLLLIRNKQPIVDWKSLADEVGTQLGIVLLTLAALHFQNLIAMLIAKRQLRHFPD